MRRIAFVLSSLTVTLVFAVSMFVYQPQASAEDDAQRSAPTDLFATSDEAADSLLAYYERMCAPNRVAARNLKEWKVRRAEVRRNIMRSIGLDPLPERVPLNVHYGGTLDRGDYIIKRVYYQTWPNVYASAYLYMPKKQGKYPVILNPHGHWDNGAKNPIVQTRCIVQAKRGYIALSVDAMHANPYPVIHVWGVTSAGTMVWNLMRGIDFLKTLPEADTMKVGCTGASGGGLQTLFMMLAEDRLTAAAPIVYPAFGKNFAHPRLWTHCGCNVVNNLMRYSDQPEVFATFAPKPSLIVCVTGDWTKTWPVDEHKDVLKVYGFYKALDKTQCIQWDWGHDYNRPIRERVYAFFDRWLKGQEYPNGVMEPDVQTESLETLTTLDDLPVEDKDRTNILKYLESRFACNPKQPSKAAGWNVYLKGLRTRLADLLQDIPVKGSTNSKAGTVEVGAMHAEKLFVRTEKDVKVPAILIRPRGSAKAPVAIILHEDGKRAVAENYVEMLQRLVSSGAAVLVPDVRLMGELRPANWPAKDWQGKPAKGNWDTSTMFWGRPAAGMSLTDIKGCLNMLASRKDIDTTRTVLIALDGAGGTALYIGALEPRLKAVLIRSVGQTYAEGASHPLVPGAPREADLPQIAAAVAPRELWLGGAGDRFVFTKAAYAGLSVSGNLRLVNQEIDEAALAEETLRALRK